MILPLVVLVVSAAAIGAGIYVTVRGFRASASRANNGGHPAADPVPGAIPHDHTATELLKHFFEGRSCAICKRAIPPVQRTGPKPGLLNPDTHETLAWDHIPNENLSTVLGSRLPLCSACVLAESFRQHHPDLVVDRDRSHHGAHAADRVVARS